MYKVIVEFHQTNILAINADDPNVAAINIRKLFETGVAKPQIRTISVFNEADNINVDLPQHVTNIHYE